jgi:hypothetical protein
VNTLVLSGTAPLVPSGTRSSCYREPKSGLPPTAKRKFGDSNFSNRESNLVRERLGRAPTTNPIISLMRLQASSNKHFCRSDFTEDPARIPPSRPRETNTRVWTPEPSASIDGAKTDPFTSRLTIGVTTELGTRSRIAAFQRGIAVLGNLLSRKFPANAGDSP